MAVPDLGAAWSFLKHEKVSLIQAPRLRPRTRHRVPPVCYADMLLHEGYEDSAALEGAIQGWESIIEFVRPDALVYNHAPTALIAAKGKGVPVLLSGTGFEIPPPRSPQASFRPWEAIEPAQLLQTEWRCVERINESLERRSGYRLSALHEIFESSQVNLATFEELDPFGPREGVQYVGPVHALPAMPHISWQNHSAHRIFAYLRSTVPGCEQLLVAMQQLDAEVLCVVPDMPPDWASRFNKLRFVTHPVDLASVLPNATLAVMYGTSTIAIALQAGVPVLLLPQVIEQYLTGLPLEAMGGGLMLREGRTSTTCRNAIDQVLSTDSYRDAAAKFADKYASFTSARATKLMYASLEGLLSS